MQIIIITTHSIYRTILFCVTIVVVTEMQRMSVYNYYTHPPTHTYLPPHVPFSSSTLRWSRDGAIRPEHAIEGGGGWRSTRGKRALLAAARGPFVRCFEAPHLQWG